MSVGIVLSATVGQYGLAAIPKPLTRQAAKIFINVQTLKVFTEKQLTYIGCYMLIFFACPVECFSYQWITVYGIVCMLQ